MQNFQIPDNNKSPNFQNPKKLKLPKLYIFPKFKKTNFETDELSKIPKNSILLNFQIPENSKLPNFQIPDNNKLPNFQIPENKKLPNFQIPKNSKLINFKIPKKILFNS